MENSEVKWPTLDKLFDEVEKTSYTAVGKRLGVRHSTVRNYMARKLTTYTTKLDSFFGRLKLAIRYLFGYKTPYGHYDSHIMRITDLPRYRSLLDNFEKFHNEFIEKAARHN